MNVDELEKLAMALEGQDYLTTEDLETGDYVDDEFSRYIAAANPAAILGLIAEYQNAIRLLSVANNGLSGSHTLAWQVQTRLALARAKGESNE